MAEVRGGDFAALLKGSGPVAARKPPKVVVLPLSGWADGQSDKPQAALSIGLVIPSDADERAAEKEAEKVAPEPHRTDNERASYNHTIIVEIVARCTTQALSAELPFFDMGALDVARRLTSAGVRRLWDELEALRAASDPAIAEAGDEEFAHLIALWDRGIGFDHLPLEEAKKCRRLVEVVRQALAEAEARAERQGVPIIEKSAPPAPVPAATPMPATTAEPPSFAALLSAGSRG